MAETPTTTVLLAPDPAVADLAFRRAEARLRARLGQSPRLRPHVRRLRGGVSPTTRRIAARLALLSPPRVLVVEADLAAWAALAAERPGRVAVVWVRPALLAVGPAVAHTWLGVDDLAWRELAAFDADLGLAPRLSLEALCAGGAAADAALDAALGLDRLGDTPAVAAPGAEPQLYAAALRALTPPRKLGVDLHAAYAPPAQGEHPTCIGGSGLRLLGQGWGAPEAHYIWNEGRLSTLVIPPEPQGRGWIVRLHGFMVVHTERTISVTASIDGRVLDTASTPPGARTDYSLTLLLPPSPKGEAQTVQLAFEGIVRPEETGAVGDTRALACALRDIRLEMRSARLPTRRPPPPLSAFDPPAPIVAADGLAGDPAFLEALAGAALGPVLVVARDAAAATAAAGACAGRELRRAHADTDEGLRDEIERALAEFHTLGERVGLVLLADEAAFSTWFAATQEEFRAGVFEAALVLATGDPERCPPEFLHYDARRPARVEVGDHVVVRRP